MDPNNQNYWFPAKQYGWGWGMPIRWQGWVVMGIFAILLGSGSVYFLPIHHDRLGFLLYAIALTLLLGFVCWLKGEPPRWRWGK